MKEGWIRKPLSEITTKIGSGATPRGGKKAYQAEGISLIRSLNVYDDGFRNKDLAKINDTQADALSNVEIKQDDVLLNITGASIARCCIPPSHVLPARVNQHVSIIRPRKNIIVPSFLHYLLISWEYKKQLLETGEDGGSTRQALTKSQLQEFTINFPEDLSEQQRIVAILDQAFEGIATAKANAEKNLQNARELFESHLNAVFTQRGEGWIETVIQNVCTLKSGTTVNKKLEKPSGDIPYVKVADLTLEGNETEIVSSSRFLNMKDIGKKSVFPPGTTIFPKRGGAILTNKKRITALPVCTDLNIMGVIPSDALEQKYLYFYFLNVDMRELGSGSSIPQINNYDINPLPICFPKSQEEQSRIARNLEELSEQAQCLEALYEQKLAALDELKQSLLHKAFAGEL